MEEDADDANDELVVRFCLFIYLKSRVSYHCCDKLLLRVAWNLVFGFLIPKFWYLVYCILVQDFVTEIDIHIRSLDGAKTIIPT